MERLIIAVALVAVAVVVAFVLQRRRPAAPAGTDWHVPIQVDRADFSRPEAPWLVAVFTSATCDACAGVWERAEPLDAGPEGPVAVQQLEAKADHELHRRYGVDAVPLVLVADDRGIVRSHFIGPVDGHRSVGRGGRGPRAGLHAPRLHEPRLTIGPVGTTGTRPPPPLVPVGRKRTRVAAGRSDLGGVGVGEV